MDKFFKLFGKIWVLFLFVFLIKAIIVWTRSGPFIFPDEGCVIQRALFFANSFQLENCSKLVKLPLGDPYPLYSLLISPIYKFFYGVLAYKISLLLNVALVSSLIFPFFKIFNHFIRNRIYCTVAAVILLFLPQFTVYENTLMTETLYSVLIVWFLNFYLNSFLNIQNKKANKIISMLLAILISFTRPMGFILLIAIMMNELIVNERKKTAIIVYFPLSILAISLALFLFSKGIIESLAVKFASLNGINGWKYLLKAFSDQINSFVIATFFAPLVIFLICIFNKGFKKFNKIKYLILVYVFLNFAISAQHIYGYLIEKDYSPNLITRYINSSVILIYVCAVIFIQKYKTFKVSIVNVILLLLLLISLFFHDSSKFGMTLNLEFLPFLDFLKTTLAKDLIPTFESYQHFLIPFIFIILILIVRENRKLFLGLFVTTIIVFSINTYYSIYFFSSPTEMTSIVNDIKKSKIAFLFAKEDGYALGEFWRLKSLTQHEITPLPFMLLKNVDLVELLNKTSTPFRESDYIITPLNLALPYYGYNNKFNIYVNDKK